MASISTAVSTSKRGNSRPTESNGALSREQIAALAERFEANPAYRVAQNAVCKTSVHDVALNRRVVTSSDFTFSHVLDDWKVTNQKRSGRCWMFAGLNLFRVGAMQKMNLKEFQFSQNYVFFWDKFERAKMIVSNRFAISIPCRPQ